jgi:hypothetical protein
MRLVIRLEGVEKKIRVQKKCKKGAVPLKESFGSEGLKTFTKKHKLYSSL